MASTEFVDPYLDPETGLLRNLVAARDNATLIAAEGALVFARAVQLLDRLVAPTGDLAELRAIHRFLFQDLFDWAGLLRTVDIRKNVERSEFFLPVSLIERAARFTVEELRTDRELRGMSRDQFVERLAHHYDQLNYIHPFREGNGRAQRVFWSRIARDAGWQLDWRVVQGDVNDEACRIAIESGDHGPLRAMFILAVTVAPDASDRDDAWKRDEKDRLGLARDPDPG